MDMTRIHKTARLVITSGTAVGILAVAGHGLYALLALAAYLAWSGFISTANTAKTRAVTAQHAALVSAVATTNQNVTAAQSTATTAQSTATTANSTATTANSRVSNLSGNNTSNNALGQSDVTGTSDNPATTGFVVQTSGVQGQTVSGSSVAQHTHSYGHIHGRGSYTINNPFHSHNLPNV